MAWRPNAEKDPNLLAKLITAFCPPNGRVVDLFAGTGSSALGALMTGRSWAGCEISTELATAAEGRIYDFFARLEEEDAANFSLEDFKYAEFLQKHPDHFVRQPAAAQETVFYLGQMGNSPVSASSVGSSRVSLEEYIEKEHWPIQKLESSVRGHSDQEMGLFAKGKLNSGTLVGCAWGRFASRSTRGGDIRLELPTVDGEEPPPDIILSEDSPGYWFNDARNTGREANCEIQVGDRAQWRVASRHRWIKIWVCFFLYLLCT